MDTTSATDMNGNKRIRAAEYVRMSTEHQQYSTENQADIIRDFAEKHDFDIVQTYADEGKSGLSIEGRKGLKKLIADVQAGNVNFQVILVYDVSRWGRFQDADESAYYEYICRRAGITVEYCAEQFRNDGSTGATIIKAVKRTMAGEYSRELSAKVFKGQCRLIEIGFRQGGPAGFGLRRMLVDMSGQQKSILERKEQKSLQTDRVILVAGPAEEVEVVQRIYQLFLEENKDEGQIAEKLNTEGIANEVGGQFTRAIVHQILTNEKYIGNNIFNRRSFKLKKKHVNNPPEMWIRKDGAFEGIVEPISFYKTQGIILARNRRYSNEEILDKLKNLFSRKGMLTAFIINETDGMPSSTVVSNRFGSLIGAYKLVGYFPAIDYSFIEINRKLRDMYPELVESVMGHMEEIGASVEPIGEGHRLLINGEISASILLTRCLKTATGANRWGIRLQHKPQPDLFIAVRMEESNEMIMDYYVLPRMDMAFEKLKIAEHNSIYLDMYRFETLEELYELSRRTALSGVA